ncbi:MAG: hypothetical protein JNL58_11050 [Planctomyces sp.]|nr:hypothetical protein [Planctomyces sp.]
MTQAVTVPLSPPSATVHEDGAAAPLTKDPELKALLEARRDALRELIRIQSEGFMRGTARVDRFPESVTMEYLEVQLELAESKEERVAAHEEALATFTAWENLVKAKQRIGLAPYSQTPVAGVARLKVEILLHKEKTRK